MTKWIAIAAVVIGGLLVWKFAPAPSGADGKDITAYVPADTILYIGGNSSAELANFMENYPLFPTTPTQSAELKNMFSELGDEEAPSAKFIASIQRQMDEANSGGSMASMLETAGIANTGAYAIYLHGAFPVAQLSLADPAAFTAMIDTAVNDSGFNYTQSTIGNAEVKQWRLNKEEGEVNLDLAIATNGNDLTITFFTNKDDDATKAERLGQTKPASSLADTGEITTLSQQYGFNDYMISLIHIERIVQGLVKPESNRFGQDLQRLLPEDSKEAFTSELSEACKTDYASLAASMPRMVGGYTDLNVKGDTLHSEGKFLIELTNQGVKGELAKMRGHIPLHTLNASDKLMTIGTGLDMDTLVPAITALWNQFTQAPYQCENLVAMQEQAKQTSPAMLAMAMGMAQGVKGLGVSIYDFELDQMMMPSTLSFIASVATENPSTLAAMTSMIPVPGINTLAIPEDGTPVVVALPMLPPSIEVKAAIKGKHLVVYSGEKAEAVANSIASEALTANGLYSFGVNYRRAGELFKLQSQGAFTQAGGGDCIAKEEMLHIMSHLKLDFAMAMDASAEGIETTIAGSMDKPAYIKVNPVGEYTISMQDESCNWLETGKETIKADGSGELTEGSEEGCATYKSKYKWTKTGNVITMNAETNEYRGDCASEWEQDTPESFECHLLNVTENSFQCLFEPGTDEAFIYLYTRN